MTGPLLRRPAVSRPSCQWSEDDYDVYAGEQKVGRIFKANAGHPAETPWMWTIVFHERRSPGLHQRLAASRDDAIAAFKASWERGRA